MTEWTDRQLQAITARNPDILVSAAAGSGKTAVLIERVRSLLKEGMQLDRMLVMTFTKAAAEEMKERLTALLAEEAVDSEHIRRQFLKLGGADISTLHSFCQKLLRQYFQAAGTDPNSRPADEAKQQELFSRAQDEALDAAHEDPTPAFLSLVAAFTEAQILEMSEALYKFLMAKEAPFVWLEAMVQEDRFQDLYAHPWYQVMLREARLMLEGARGLLAECAAVCALPEGPGRYASAISDDLAMVDLMQQALQQPRPALGSPRFTRLSSKKPPETEDPALTALVKDVLRSDAKGLVNAALALLPQDAAQADAWMADIRDSLPRLQGLADLVKDMAGRYQALKAAELLWDFHDMEHLALLALQDDQVRDEVVSSYDALFVDEYQDISQIQEAIIRRLRGPDNTLFMVGDVKQSIYRFRLADPSLFLHKHGHFSVDAAAPERLITLKDNFRSRANILHAVNLIFQRAMRERATEIAYDSEAMLTTDKKDLDDPPVEVHLLLREGEPPADIAPLEALEAVAAEAMPEDEEGPAPLSAGETEQAFVYEARLVARRIRELVGTPITDKSGSREASYRDIVILLRNAAGRAAVMAEILNAQDIPTYSDAQGEFYTQTDVRDVLSLLQVLDNPLQDVPLLSALASPVFGFTPDDLARLRLSVASPKSPLHEAFFALAAQEGKCKAAAERLARWRLMAGTMPLDRFLSLLLRESGLYALAGAWEDGRLRRANLRLLVAQAAPENEPLSLRDFVERALKAIKSNLRDRSASLGMQEDVVRIMTMHKSKGLQFPMVIIPDLARHFAGSRFELPLLMDAQTGLALRQVNVAHRYYKDGFGVSAIRVKQAREEQSEEARLLYVALTRAKERLILVGSVPRLDTALTRWGLPEGDYAASAAKSMLDWVCAPLHEPLSQGLAGLYTAHNGSRFLIAWHDAYSLTAEERSPAAASTARQMPPGITPPEDLFRPLQPPLRVPQKSSVTALLRRTAHLESQDETLEVKRRELQPARLMEPVLESIAGERLTAAQRGAAAHKVLCALDPAEYVGLDGAALEAALTAAMEGMLQKNLLTQAERDSIRMEDVQRFYRSSLARRMAGSPERHAEWPFTLLADEDMILQGVLDSCFVEEGAWVLVDYKTDWGDPDTIHARYRDQMRWYMRALRDITGQPVKEAWLYLLRRGEAVQVTEEEAIRLKADEGGLPG